LIGHVARVVFLENDLVDDVLIGSLLLDHSFETGGLLLLSRHDEVGHVLGGDDLLMLAALVFVAQVQVFVAQVYQVLSLARKLESTCLQVSRAKIVTLLGKHLLLYLFLLVELNFVLHVLFAELLDLFVQLLYL
jgi:hypothetical protein